MKATTEELIRETLKRNEMEYFAGQIKEECISFSLDVCEILPAALSENVGDYAAISCALHASER